MTETEEIRQEYYLRILFTSGAEMVTARMNLTEATALYSKLEPGRPLNQGIKEVQLYQVDVTETITFVSRRPEWGA